MNAWLVCYLSLLCLQQMPLIRACSDVALTNTSLYDAIVSARNYDFFAQDVLTMQISAIPAGTDITYTPTLNCQSPAGLSASQTLSKHGFICATVARPAFVDLYKAKCGSRDYSGFVSACFEGFNTAGLSVGALTQQSQPFPPNATSTTAQKPGLYFNDVPVFLLASYKTIAEIRSSFTPNNFRVVNNPGFFQQLYKWSPIAATRINHFAIHDATGASAVLEFTKAGDNYGWEVIDNPIGVLTNSPDFRTHLRYAEEFEQQQVAKHGVNGRVMTPGFCGVGWNITTYLNDNCNSMSRFTTLAMLKKHVANTPFPSATYQESPAANRDPTQQAIIQALRLLDRVKIPGHWPNLGPVGPAPKNQVLGAEEMTLTQHVKDHRRLIWYVKTAANEQWARIDLKTLFGVPPLDKTAGGGREVKGSANNSSHSWSTPVKKPVHKEVGSILPPTRQWATDISTEVMS